MYFLPSISITCVTKRVLTAKPKMPTFILDKPSRSLMGFSSPSYIQLGDARLQDDYQALNTQLVKLQRILRILAFCYILSFFTACLYLLRQRGFYTFQIKDHADVSHLPMAPDCKWKAQPEDLFQTSFGNWNGLSSNCIRP